VGNFNFHRVSLKFRASEMSLGYGKDSVDLQSDSYRPHLSV
jgi:hypothetical protein